MPEQIISASGAQNGMVVNDDGSINTTNIVAGTPIVNPANQFIFITSGTATGITGSEVGSIIQFIGAGSLVQVFTWADDNINTIGSWI